jgi:SEC-C motif-containing protein
METRFAAYAVGEVDYIVDTTDPQGSAFEEDAHEWRDSIRRFSESTNFLGLQVLAFEEDGDRATVRFQADLSRDGEDASFEELSAFRRVDGRWLYSSGEYSD